MEGVICNLTKKLQNSNLQCICSFDYDCISKLFWKVCSLIIHRYWLYAAVSCKCLLV